MLIFLILNPEVTFLRLLGIYLRLEACHTSSAHRPLLFGTETFCGLIETA
jgi:hypothetical protein